MRYRVLHRWNVDPREAIAIQNDLKSRLVLRAVDRTFKIAAGVDLAFSKTGKMAVAVIVVLDEKMNVVESVHAWVEVGYPYIPGLLVFREGPAFLKAWEKLRTEPDVVFFDGQGIAHPRGIGIASHMGLFIEKPTLGVAKSRLYGRHKPVGNEQGDMVPVFDDFGKIIGMVLRTKKNVKPVYVSPGHLMDVETAVELTQKWLMGYRLPEPTRLAHKFAGTLKKQGESFLR